VLTGILEGHAEIGQRLVGVDEIVADRGRIVAPLARDRAPEHAILGVQGENRTGVVGGPLGERVLPHGHGGGHVLLVVRPSRQGDADEEDVATAMTMWQDALAKGTSDDPGPILSLYAEDGVLWGTISSQRRDDPAAIRDYFVNAYKALPNLGVTFEDPYIRVYGGDTAVNTGSYTFSYEKDGATQSLPARYSFTLVKRDGDWQIVDHHSSAMPQPPK
jgi:uncharacterized protein (TIGR02246 family)